MTTGTPRARNARTRIKDLGRVAIGVGLMLLALHILLDTLAPAEEAPGMHVLLNAITGDPLSCILAAATLTWVAPPPALQKKIEARPSIEIEFNPGRSHQLPRILAKIVMGDGGDEFVRNQVLLGPARLERRGHALAIAFFRLGQQMIDLGVVGCEILRQPAFAHPEAPRA
jgi:hypothetical protein